MLQIGSSVCIGSKNHSNAPQHTATGRRFRSKEIPSPSLKGNETCEFATSICSIIKLRQEPHVVPGCSHPRTPRQGVGTSVNLGTLDSSTFLWNWDGTPHISWGLETRWWKPLITNIYNQYTKAYAKALLKELRAGCPPGIKRGYAKSTKLAV